jgi:NADPH:quinone reductase-like Zn-dependent oxidoreductase
MITTEERRSATGSGRTTTMQAIVQDTYGSAAVLYLSQIEKPPIGEHDVLVRVRAAGVNPADWAITNGLPYIARPLYGLARPTNPVRGTDVAGEVEAVGARVARFRPGDAVFGWCGHLGGAFAEYAAVPEDDLVRKPARLTFPQAAAIPMAGSVALEALRVQARVRGGQKVLVNGAAGGIGTFAVQIAHWLGAEVTGVCSTKNVDLVRSIGADHVIDYTKEDFTRTEKRYDVVLDNVANRSLRDLRRAVTPTGILLPNGGGFDHRWFASGGRLIKAKVSFSLGSQSVRTFLTSSKLENLVALSELAEAGLLTPVIDRGFPLHETPEAIDYVGRGHARGKVTIIVSEED